MFYMSRKSVISNKSSQEYLAYLYCKWLETVVLMIVNRLKPKHKSPK